MCDEMKNLLLPHLLSPCQDPKRYPLSAQGKILVVVDSKQKASSRGTFTAAIVYHNSKGLSKQEF